MRHLLSIDDLTRDDIERILDRAAAFEEVSDREIKKVPALRGRTVLNLFYEASTRTRSSFELAAKRLSADVVNFSASGSSVEKGESLKDTVLTLTAHSPDAIVIRTPFAGAAALVAGWTPAAIVNAGDGKHEHPTQALLDVYTLRQKLGSLEGRNIWIVGDVAHSRVARSNILAFRKMGADVTVCGPPTLIPRGIEALGCAVRYDLDDLREADVVYALRMQHERMDQDFVPEPARVRRQLPDQRPPPRARARCSCTPARSTAASSSPARSSTRRRRSSRCRSRRGSSSAWRSSTRCWPARATSAAPRADRAPAGMSVHEPARNGASGVRLVSAPARPADLLLRDVHVLDPRTGIDGRHDVLVRDGEIAEIAAPGTLTAPDGAEVVEGEGRHLFPAFVDPHVHLRTPGQEHKEDLETGTRSAAAGGYCAVIAMPNTTPVIDSAPILGALRDAAAREARVPVGFMPAITRGLQGEELTEMAELRALGAVGFTDDGRPVASAGMLRQALQYQRLCGGVLALHEEDPALSGKGAMHEGDGQRAARRRRHPERQRVDDGRPRLRARRLRGRAHPHPAPVGVRVGRGDPRREGARRRGHLRGLAAPPDADRRGRAHARHAPQDEPAAARRGGPPGAHRGAARRHDRLHRHRPRAARARREGGPVRAGADGHDRAGDRVRRGLHRARHARHADARARRREAHRGPRPARPVRPGDRGRRAGQPRARRPRRRVGGGGGRLREPLGELLLRRPHAARAGAADGRGGRRRLPRALDAAERAA